MAEYAIIVDGDVRGIWGTQKQAEEWVDAGNYITPSGPTPEMPEGYNLPNEVVIAKIVSRKERIRPDPPAQPYTDWRPQ